MATQLVIGNLALSSPVLMAPMAGFTDLPFRLCLRSLGGLGLAYTEMLQPDSLIYGKTSKARQLVATNDEDQPLGFQIYGKDPEKLARGAQWLVERGAKLIDINMGCPQKRISSSGSGAALLRKPFLAVEIVRRVRESVPVPVTAKLRLGWDNTDVAVELAKEFEKLGVAAVTVHGRTRMQGFTGQVNLDAIRQVVESVERIPVIANGDIVSVETAREMFARTGCAGIMLGRQPLKVPWIIRDIARDLEGLPPLPPPTADERREMVLRHFDLCVKFYGDVMAVPIFRKWIRCYISMRPFDRADLIELMQMTDADALRPKLAAMILKVFA